MAQIIQTPSRSAYGGQAAGSALGQALQGLAGTFVNEFARGKQRTEFNKLYPEQADLLSMFHGQPAVQQKIIAGIEKNNLLQLQQRMAAEQAQRDQEVLADAYEQQGLPRDLAYTSPNTQKQYIAALKATGGAKGAPKGMLGKIQPAIDYLAGEEAIASNPNQLRQVAPGEAPTPYAVTPEEAEQLRQAGIDVPLSNANTPLGQILSSLALGAGAGYLGRHGDIFAGLSNLVEGGASKLGLPNEEESKAYRQQVAQSLGLGDNELLQNIMQNKLIESGPRGKLPTSEMIKKGAGKLAKGTAAEKYVVPQTLNQQRAEQVGHALSILAKPLTAATTAAKVAGEAGKSVLGAASKAVGKELMKGFGVAVGGDAAGWMTERATGSKLAGDFVRNGLYLAYNMWPGSIADAAKNEYNQFQKEVIDKATKQNVTANMTKYIPQVRKIENEIHKLAPGDTQTWLANEWVKSYGDLFQRVKQDPEKLWSKIKDMKEAFRSESTPQQAKDIYKQMINVVEKALEDVSERVSKGGFAHLQNADRLYATNAQLFEQAGNFAKSARVLAPGAILLLSGGYKAMVAAGAGSFAAKYMSKMLADTTMRSLLSQMAKATAMNNTQLVAKLTEKINKRSIQVSPKEAREMNELMRKRGIQTKI